MSYQKPTCNCYAEQAKRADARTNLTNNYKLSQLKTQLACQFASVTCATFTNAVTEPAFYSIFTSPSAESGTDKLQISGQAKYTTQIGLEVVKVTKNIHYNRKHARKGSFNHDCSFKSPPESHVTEVLVYDK